MFCDPPRSFYERRWNAKLLRFRYKASMEQLIHRDITHRATSRRSRLCKIESFRGGTVLFFLKKQVCCNDITISGTANQFFSKKCSYLKNFPGRIGLLCIFTQLNTGQKEARLFSAALKHEKYNMLKKLLILR
jgi:hypothetical protein